MSQYGFFFDQSRCSGCHACAVACKNWNQLPPGPLKYLKVYEYEKGHFPSLSIHFQWVTCYHCQDPACIRNCPSEAIYKEEKYGAVLIELENCIGCRVCYEVCPYGAPSFASDNDREKAHKCTLCFDRLEQGLKPVCVVACPTRAIDFGPLKNLIERYGERRDLEDLPESRITKPSVLFKPRNKKRQLVYYDQEKALRLMMVRDALPNVFTSPDDVKKIPEGLIGRDRLILKHKSVSEIMRYTRNDEG
ncbi:MAG: 4Fe-4S dicluster domain-containing protein [Deltaproteobacteria bacterium]|nr:4Fe-4S dicluster domain-containing protein [Deltaproteobacteria bacterium]